MDIQSLKDYAMIIGPVLTGLSLLLGVVYFIFDLKRDRTKQTLDYWERVNQELKIEKAKLGKDCGNTIDKETAKLIMEGVGDEVQINKVINIYERLSTGVNIGVYDIKVINKLVGQNILNNYKNFEDYIEYRRIKLNRPFAWVEFQKLANRIEKLRE